MDKDKWPIVSCSSERRFHANSKKTGGPLNFAFRTNDDVEEEDFGN